MLSDADFYGVGGVGGYENLDSQNPKETLATDKRHSMTIPVTINQVLERSEIRLHFGELMQIVGRIKKVNITSTKMVYTVEDWSGSCIDAMLWLEEGDDDLKRSSITKNVYAKLTGKLRRNENSEYIFLYNIEAIDNLQQLTFHYLQIVYIPLKAEEQSQVKIPENNVDMPINNQNGMNFTPQQNRVYLTIQNAKSDAGIEMNELLHTVKISADELNKIIEFLIDEGHIYATIDDFHFKATDA